MVSVDPILARKKPRAVHKSRSIWADGNTQKEVLRDIYDSKLEPKKRYPRWTRMTRRTDTRYTLTTLSTTPRNLMGFSRVHNEGSVSMTTATPHILELGRSEDQTPGDNARNARTFPLA